MRSSSILVLLTVAIQAPTALSQLFVSDLFNRVSQSLNPFPPQEPMQKLKDIVMPPSADDTEPSAGTDGVIISDVIGRDRVINIFAGFTRDIDNISKRLDDNNENTTVLAPLNSEIQKLPRKPWEDPKDYEELGANAYGGSDGENRANGNLRRFVEAHIVPVSPWSEGEKVDTVGGGKVWWESKDGKKTVRIVKLQRLSKRLGPYSQCYRYIQAISKYRVSLVRSQMARYGLSKE